MRFVREFPAGPYNVYNIYMDTHSLFYVYSPCRDHLLRSHKYEKVTVLERASLTQITVVRELSGGSDTENPYAHFARKRWKSFETFVYLVKKINTTK